MKNLLIHVACVQMFVPGTNLFYNPLVVVKTDLNRSESEEEIKSLLISEARKSVPSEYSEFRSLNFSHI